MKKITFIPLLFVYALAFAQAVGIGTTTPNTSSVLDLGPSAKPIVLPRLSLTQMNAVINPSLGMMVYNTDEGQLYSYMRYRTSASGNNRWQPVSTGPRLVAWGIVDSFATEINGSLTSTVTWDNVNNWYKLSLTNPVEYYRDSMLLMITPVGNGSWNQAVSTGEVIDVTGRYATIKFSDISRMVAGFNTLQSRRRSGFHFILYDLRKDPY